jgi:hypothetical protein
LKYSGETWGENIESGWAEQNQTAGSMKEQNDGHWHDSLDDYFGFGIGQNYVNFVSVFDFSCTMSEQRAAALLFKSYEVLRDSMEMGVGIYSTHRDPSARIDCEMGVYG